MGTKNNFCTSAVLYTYSHEPNVEASRLNIKRIQSMPRKMKKRFKGQLEYDKSVFIKHEGYEKNN